MVLQGLGRATLYTLSPTKAPSLHHTHHSHARRREPPLSVDLVVASMMEDDTSWTSKLAIPELNVLRYVNNYAFAARQPRANKGNEALVYLTYLHDHYPNFPDVAIFVHGQEIAWHVEGTFLRNMSNVLSQLDLAKVVDRGYFNLRRAWKSGCPSWIDTTRTRHYWGWYKEEEPYMREAWLANFNDSMVPDEIGGPCCSQFAVSRETMLRQTKEQYKKSMDWIIESPWKNRITGRVWERMWPQLFTNSSTDCGHSEKDDLCEMYGICFRRQEDLRSYKDLWAEREKLQLHMSLFHSIWAPRRAAGARRKIAGLVGEIEDRLNAAWDRGEEERRKALASGTGAGNFTTKRSHK